MEQCTHPSNLHPHPLNVAVYGADDLPGEFLDSIREFGILTPLVVLEDGTIISGHRRWQAAKQLRHAEVPVLVIALDSDLAIAEHIIEANRQRDKTFSVKMREAEVLQKIETERAKLRQATSTGGPAPQLSPTRDSAGGRSASAVAAQVGIGSRQTYDRAKTVWDKAKQGDRAAMTLVTRIDAGETTIGAAYRELKVPAAEVPAPAEIAPGGWGVNPTESILHWWERDPAVKTLWSTLVSVSVHVKAVILENLTDDEQQVLTTMVRNVINDLENLCPI